MHKMMKSEHLGWVGFGFAVADDADNIFVRLEISRLAGRDESRVDEHDEDLARCAIFLPIIPPFPVLFREACAKARIAFPWRSPKPPSDAPDRE